MSDAARRELAPAGTIRVGINFGNTVLVRRDVGGQPCGIAPDLAGELARQLGVGLEFVTYEAAGRTADGAARGEWDAAFLAADPDRANTIAFTEPYLEIDSTYLVPPGSRFQDPEALDCDGVRIAVSAKSAYDLFLTRHLKHAQLVRAPGPEQSVELFFSEKLDALAGIRPMLLDVAAKQPGSRVLEGRYSTVNQAIGTPQGRPAAGAWLQEFVAAVKASGFVAAAIRRHGVAGVVLPGS